MQISDNELLRAALILNFIFTTLAFREKPFFKIFSKITSSGYFLNKFIIFQPLSITILWPITIQIGIINKWPLKSTKSNILVVIVFFLFEFGLFYTYPDKFMDIMFVLVKIFNLIHLVWIIFSQPYLIPLNLFLSFCLLLLFVVTFILLLGYLIVTPIKMLLTISEISHKYISETKFGIIVYPIFVLSWILTYITTR